MEWKQFFDKNKKIILIIFIILTLIFIIETFLIYDYNKTKRKQLEKNIEAENYKNDLPKELKENIPDKGNICFIEFNTNKNKDILPLLKQEKFRKSLYYALNRKEITQNENNLKPLSVLFTKAFFTDNKKCFTKPFLPHNEKSMEIYEDLDLKNYGFNENKALKYLEESFNELSPEEKKKNYVFRLGKDEEFEDINIITSIQEQINNLFKKFLEKNTYNQDKLKIEIVSGKDYDMKLFYPIEIDEYNEEMYYLFFISCLSYENNSKIDINLSHIKKYLHKNIYILENENTLLKINKIDSEKIKEYLKSDFLIQNLLNNEQPFNSEGIFTGKIIDFFDFMENNIYPLFPSFGIRSQYQQEESEEIQELKQKTFEEIFEKVLCLLHKEMLQIPVCISENKN
ncbi:hypothetical protein RS022_06430 [Candidatus Phytoplasma rubi]|uniref:Effector n=1 Tax=Candidatus Phytoplasma rubi TaxID=399025 RepID=A0ABY7BS81_9MOLU|nr:hypothetical protein [Candidatus Phytoplasma rubi]WAN63480.1 hypothetical protein RS022_06430 [Candidatus Phytoplasma rubi]